MVMQPLETVLGKRRCLLLFLFLIEAHLRPAWCDKAGSAHIPDVSKSHETWPEDRLGNSTTGSAVMFDFVANDTLPDGVHITERVCDERETQNMLFCNTYITTPTEMENDPSAAKEKEDFDISFLIDFVVKPAISVPGCMLNVLNIYVLAKQSKATANNCLLIGLSVADLSFLLCTLILYAYRILKKLNYPLYIYVVTSARYEWNRYFTMLLTGRSSNAFIIILSLERFIAVKFPFTVKSSWLSRHPSKILASVFAFVTVLLFPNMFRKEYVEGFDPASNQSFVSLKLTHFAKTNPEFYTVYTYVILVVLRLVPVLSVVVLNIAIIVTLKFSRKSWNSSQISDDKRRAKELKVTRMLVTISFLFLVCVSPGLVHSLLANFLPGYHTWRDNSLFWSLIQKFYPVLDIINSTVNFFVYVFMSENFRATFKELLCRKPRAIASCT